VDYENVVGLDFVVDLDYEEGLYCENEEVLLLLLQLLDYENVGGLDYENVGGLDYENEHPSFHSLHPSMHSLHILFYNCE
jgi:hypothetical protein